MTRYSFAVATALALSLAAHGPAGATTVYIPEGSAGEVLVVDAATDTVIGRFADLPDIHGLGGTAASRYLVAGSYSETPAGKAPDVARPAGVSADEHAAHHGPAARPAGPAVSIVTIIDAADGSAVRRLEVPGAVHHVAVAPDGRHAVATHPNAEGISVIDLAALAVTEFVPTGPMANYAVFNPDGSQVYVSNTENGLVSEIEATSWMVLRNLPAGEGPEHIVMAPDGRTLYVANVEAGRVSALSLEEGRVVRAFAVGGELHGIDISDDGGTLFVSGKGEDKLAAIDLATGKMRTAPLGPAPYHLTVVRGTGKLYVSSRDEPKVWVVDQATLAPSSTLEIRGEGHQMVVLP